MGAGGASRQDGRGTNSPALADSDKGFPATLLGHFEQGYFCRHESGAALEGLGDQGGESLRQPRFAQSFHERRATARIAILRIRLGRPGCAASDASDLHGREEWARRTSGANYPGGFQPVIDKRMSNLPIDAHDAGGFSSGNNEPRPQSMAPSTSSRGGKRNTTVSAGLRVIAVALVVCGCWIAGCDSGPSKPAAAEAAKPAEPAVPEEMDSAAKVVLGREAQVLAFGDLAKTGKPEILAANVVPRTPQNTIPGTVVTRAVV